MTKIVQIYWNSHKQLWSIRDKQTRRVLYHQPIVLLQNCKFHVGLNGNSKVRKTGHKNVHAWIEGTLIKDEKLQQLPNTKVRYNPFKHTHFITNNNQKIEHAQLTLLKQDRTVLTWKPNIYPQTTPN